MENDDMSIRVASFAYYLDTAKDNLVHQKISAQASPILFRAGENKPATKKTPFSFSVFKVPGPIQDPTAGFSFPRDIQKDSEISVFGADKYFNMKLEYQTGIKIPDLCKNQGPVNIPRVRTRSLCSEASSLNSQTALLLKLQRSESQIKQKKALERRVFTRFGCPPSCFDKKAIQITELSPHLKVQTCREGASNGSEPTRKTGSEKINHLALIPVPNPSTEKIRLKKQLKAGDLEDSRNSIEIFGSVTTTRESNIATNLENKFPMLTWDAIPKSQGVPTCTTCDDMASDASSDLFEIENISRSLNPYSTTDDLSNCLSSRSHYAPSEASIQWSVVTASAANYSSYPSDYYNDDTSVSVAADVIARKKWTKINPKSRSGGRKETQKSPRVGILGCKSYKAVDVAENVSHKINEKVKHQGLDLIW